MRVWNHENDVFTPYGRSVHTGEKNGWTDGTARFHVHTHQGSQILHDFSWRFRKYKFRVTVMAAVTCFEVWVETAAVRQTTTLRLAAAPSRPPDESSTSIVNPPSVIAQGLLPVQLPVVARRLASTAWQRERPAVAQVSVCAARGAMRAAFRVRSTFSRAAFCDDFGAFAAKGIKTCCARADRSWPIDSRS